MPTKKKKSKRAAPKKEPKVVVIHREGGLPPLRLLDLKGKIKRSEIRKAMKAVFAERQHEEPATNLER